MWSPHGPVRRERIRAMESVPTIALLIFVATITPGPNNYFMMQLAASHGARAVVHGIAGIVVGGLLLLGLVALGLGRILDQVPLLRTGVLLAGVVWLVWAGVRMALAAPTPAGAPQTAPPASDAMGLLGFQLINPKAWTLVLTVVASHGQAGGLPQSLIGTAVLLVVIPVPCLLAWAVAGEAASRWLSTPARQVAFNRVMGTLLAASALALLFPILEGGSTP
jgi:threonine/homoserine/homoserine lactone efflux protein